MDKCDCYIEDRQLVDYTPLMKPVYKTVALCFGTMERDQCSCGGDRTKCDFYPEAREKAKKKENTTSYKEIIKLLVRAIEQNTVNTYQIQGSAGADQVFEILKEVEDKLENISDK